MSFPSRVLQLATLSTIEANRDSEGRRSPRPHQPLSMELEKRMHPRQLSQELREGDSPELNYRRWIIGLSMVGTTMAQFVSMYQTGILGDLVDPPLPLIDSAKVDASDYAYSRLETPDGFMMLVNYGITAWLAGAGGKDRAKDTPLLPIALSVKTLIDSLVALELAREEWNENKAFCAYCQVATLCSFASFALSLPEAMTAWQHLQNQQSQA